MKQRAETLSAILKSKGRLAKAAEDLFPAEDSTGPVHQTYYFEPDDGLELPHVVVPAEQDVEDIFAAVATYYPQHSPISSLVHVVGIDCQEQFQGWLNGAPKKSHKKAAELRRVCLGAALGEATLAGINSSDSGAPSYASCRRTLSFSLCRAAQLLTEDFNCESVLQRWIRLRKLTGLSVNQASVESVLLVYQLASRHPRANNASTSKDVLDALSGHLNGGQKRDKLYDALLKLYPKAKRYAVDLSGSFDGRMSAFTKIVEEIQADSKGQIIDDIAVAYFCNLIQPGSFVHISVLIQLNKFNPAALIWYGVFVAVTDRAVPFSYKSGLCAKLERDVVEEFSFDDRPSCDIALDELEILSRGVLKAEAVNPSQQRALLVALIPGVNIFTRFGSEPAATSERRHSESDYAELRNRLTRVLEDAMSILKNPASVQRMNYGYDNVRKKK